MNATRALVSNHQQVLEVLQAKKIPMTAYEILAAVRKHGITAPPTVYRALTRLMGDGLVHRVESINAFVVCAEHEHHHGPAVFAICNDCGSVDELEEKTVIRKLTSNAARHGFKVEATTIELKGKCSACAAA